MRLKDSLTDIIERLEPAINKLDNAYLAFGVYAAGRLGDDITTALLFEKYGRDPSLEKMPVARFFMEHFGVHEGSVILELGGLALVLGIYKFYSKKGWGRPNIIPYMIGIGSIPPIINNLQHYFGY